MFSSEIPKPALDKLLYDVIDALEEEKTWIDNQINQAPSEEVDFLNAHALLQGRSRVSELLRIVKSFRSPSEVKYDRLLLELKRLRAFIAKEELSNILPHKLHSGASKYSEKRLKEILDNLVKFEFNQLDLSSKNELLEKELDKLLDGENREVIIEFNSKYRDDTKLFYTIQIDRQNDHIRIKVYDHDDNWEGLLSEYLRTVSFVKVELYYHRLFSKEEIILDDLVQLVSRITYEGLQASRDSYDVFLKIK